MGNLLSLNEMEWLFSVHKNRRYLENSALPILSHQIGRKEREALNCVWNSKMTFWNLWPTYKENPIKLLPVEAIICDEEGNLVIRLLLFWELLNAPKLLTTTYRPTSLIRHWIIWQPQYKWHKLCKPNFLVKIYVYNMTLVIRHSWTPKISYFRGNKCIYGGAHTYKYIVNIKFI